MTVSTSTNRVQYNTNGTAGPWTVPFYFLEDSHLAVTYTTSAGLETLLTLTTHYSVTGAGDEDGGTVTTVSSYAAGGTITILRSVPATQDTEYVETDSFPAVSHMMALDKLTMLVQQALEVIGRALVFSPSDPSGSTLPAAAARASKLVGFDSDGVLSMTAPADGSAAALALTLASSALASDGAGAVGYDPDLSYAAGTVGEILTRERTLLDFGAVGDGSTDDSSAIMSAFTDYAGRVIDGLGRTYKCDSVLTGLASNTTLRNMTLDFSDIATTNARYIVATGSKGSPVTLTSNLAAEGVTIAVGSTATFSADQWAWLQSTAVWSAIDGTPYGQFVKVKSVDSSTALTLYAGPAVPFNTADSASISPVAPVERVKFQNVRVIGSGANSQHGLWVYYGLDCTIDSDCRFEDCDYTAVALWRCINSRAAPTVLRARAVGLAYGVGIYGGSFGCAVDGGYGEDVRHYVTVGDNDGINVNCRATNNVVNYARSAGIDSHNSSINFLAQGNQITLADGEGDEGITLQGLNGQAIGNTIRNVTGIGIFIQPLVTASGYKTKAIARGNHVHLAPSVSGTPIGVYFQNNATTGSDFEAGDMDGNFVYGGAGSTGSIHFYVIANNTSGQVKNIAIRGNVSVDVAITHALYIRALATSGAIENVAVVGNHFKTSGTHAVYLLAGGTTSTVDDVIISANTIEGGSTANIGIVGNPGAVGNVVEDNNIFSGGGDLFVISGTTTGLKFKSARHVGPITIASGTGSTEPDTDTYIFNNAGTVTLTLPSAATYPGRELILRTIQAQAVDSASSNVVPRTSATAGTAILPATAGAWAILKSDGTNWQTVAGS